MTQVTPPTPGTAAGQRPAGWRGKGQREIPRHRWQREPGAGRLARGPIRTLKIVALFALAAGLSVLLLYYLLYAPARSPIVTIVATDYAWPLPPNAWAAEDLAALGDLDQQTLQITDISDAWRSKDRGLDQLKNQLAAARLRHPKWQPIIIYLSMHGAVDGSGRACLIPPGASPHDSSTWLPLARVLETITLAELPPRQPKLLVLDCSRQLANWHAGILSNTFSEALLAEANAAQVPGLVILNSASPGEAGVAAAELRGSVFGHYLRLGLAGAADRWSAGGNGNGRVSLHELAGYLARNVDAWVRHHQAARQQPMLVPADAADFDVAVAMSRRSRQRLEQRAQRIERLPPPVTGAQLHEHWAALDQLREASLWRFDPLAWRTLEHRLLWLEQLAAAGSAYEGTARALNEELGQALRRAQQQLVRAREERSLPAYVTVLDPAAVVPVKTANSLPLAKWLGTDRPANLQRMENALASCIQAPSESNLQAFLQLYGDQAGALTTEGALVVLWQRYHVPSLWPSAAPLSEILAARRAAEQLAAPVAGTQSAAFGDERAHAWLRPQLQKLDALCRQMEDAALLGPQMRNVEALALAAQAEIKSAEDSARSMADVFAARDRLWAELPYFASWLARRQFDSNDQKAADAAMRQTLLPLIARALELEEQLVRQEPAPDGSTSLVWTAAGAAKEVQERLAVLENHWADELQRLQSAPATGRSIARIDAALALPLVPADSRQRLRQKRIDIAATLAAEFRAEDGETVEKSAPPPTPPDREIVANWGGHPLVRMISEETDLAAAGERVRRELRTLALADLTDPEASVQSDRVRAPGMDKNQPAPEWKALCRAESRFRKAAALWFEPPANDPVRALRNADVQQLLLASSRRALDDFFGPLFAIAVDNYLTAAQAIAPLSPAAQAELAQQRSLLAARRVAAQEALAVTASEILLADQATAVTGAVVVRKRPGDALRDLPAGTMAVFLTDSQGRIGNEAWPINTPPDLPTEGDIILQAEVSLASESLTRRGPQLVAVATLRGNDFLQPVLLRSPGGTRVEHSRPAQGPPQVTVLGTDIKRASIVFVLDCSNSMREPTAQEGPDAAGRPQTPRMDVAKAALRAMLAELAAPATGREFQGGARVGVLFFGHRVGWSTTEDNKLLRQTDWPAEIPAELRPANDVEAVLKLGRFDGSAAALVSDKLAAVRPWGESPLYLAISQALAEFGPDDAERTVVAITDGQNYQFNPPPASQRTSQQVIDAARQARASVFIVGFDIPAGESAAASREFEEIARGTGGQFLPASGATALLHTLQSLLRPGAFQVAASGGFTRQAELGRTVDLPLPAGRQPYTVTYEGMQMPIEVSGGERVELAVSQADRRLRILPYQNPRAAPLVTSDGARSPLYAGLHRSVRSKEGVAFPLSLQDEGGQFVPRPAELWVEITPRTTLAEEPRPYIFYDAPYVPGTPVPLVRLEARDWPAGASRAGVRLWMRQLPVEPAERVPLSKVANVVPEKGVGFPIRGVAGVSYQARTLRGEGNQVIVGLVERHGTESAGVGSLKVVLAPPADHVVHQFDADSRIVLHTFRYDAPAEELLEKIELQFTSRDAIFADAYRLEREVEVNVSERLDLIDLSRAAGQR